MMTYLLWLSDLYNSGSVWGYSTYTIYLLDDLLDQYWGHRIGYINWVARRSYY